MNTVLSDMGALLRAVPDVATTADEIAAWYERKARLFDRIAAESAADPTDATRAARVASDARAHALHLRVTARDEPSSAA